MMTRLLSSIMGAGCLAGAVSASPLPPYGVNAHLAGDEYPDCARTCDLMRRGSIGCVRVDVAWRFIQPTESSVPDFSRFDKVMDEAERNGLEVLPILCGEPPSWAHPFASHADGIVALADAFARRYRGRFSTLEFFNEPNNSPDWSGGNAALYAQVMRRVREAVRAVDPAVRLAFGGVGGAFGEYLRAVYEAGGKDAFDVVNIHPYSNPQPPECAAHVRLENQIRTAQAVMAEFDDGSKPLIVTEEGWSTQAEGIGAAESTILQTGLRLARPEQATWRVVYVESVEGGGLPPTDVAVTALGLLPEGSEVKIANAERLLELLSENALDCVIYPVRNASYPAAVQDAVLDFVRKGGVLVELGGVPLGTPDDPARDAAADRVALRLDVRNSGTDPFIPSQATAFATDRALAAGFMPDLSGYPATQFLTGRLLKEGDEFIPLVAAKREGDDDLVAAAVYRFGSDMKGSVIVSALVTLHPAQQIGTTTEENQARFIARACGIAFAMGVESLFVYEFRSPGGNPCYSECHYGIVRDDFSPKPAFAAYRTFANMRPPGSVNADEEWHDADWKTFFPEWSVPGGAKGGMFWSASGTDEIVRTFDGGVRFYDMTGQEITPRALGGGSYALALSGSPIYWMERSDAVTFGSVTGECGYNFTNVVVRVGVTSSSLPVEDGYRVRAVVLGEGGVPVASADVPFAGQGTYELPTGGEALVPGLRYAFEVSVVDAAGRKVAVADTSDASFVAANFVEGFSADAGTGKTVGGRWEPEPAIQSGEYLFRGVSDQLFDVAVPRPGVTRVETVFRLESAFLDADVPDVLADLRANPPRQALTATSADGETGLAWMMPVLENGLVVLRELHGVEARLGTTYRCVMETDCTRSPAQVSCLLTVGDGTPARLVDADGYGWFASPQPSVEPVRKVGYRGRMHVRRLEGRPTDVTLFERTGNSIRLLTNLAVALNDLETGDFVVDRDGWRFKWTDGSRYMVYDATDGTCHVREGVPANGLPSFVTHVLGLDAESASSLPRASIVRSTDPDGYIVSLGDSVRPVSGARIGYVLRSAADPSFGTSSTSERRSDPTFWVPYRGETALFFKIEIHPGDW